MNQYINTQRQNSKVYRHCMIVHAYYPLGETRVEREALALSDHGVDVHVICLQRPEEARTEVVRGVCVDRMPVRRHRGSGLFTQMLEYLTFFIMAFLQLSKLHLREKFAVVQVHNLPDFLVFAALIPKLTGSKVILDLHDLMPEFYAEKFQRSMNHILVRIIRWQEWLSCWFADHVITVTELWRQALITRGQPPQKVSVVMNIADDRVFSPTVAPPVAMDGYFRLIYHGILGKRQGLDLVLKAIDKIRDETPDLRLCLHGWGEYRQTLENMVSELRLQNQVQFSRSSLATEELPRLLRQANLGIVPYRNGIFTGGILPTKLMEYAALGIPAIAARTPAISAYFDDEAVRFFTPENVDELADCILDLYRNRSELAELSKNISKFNKRFNWTKTGTEYVALINALRLSGQAADMHQ